MKHSLHIDDNGEVYHDKGIIMKNIFTFTPGIFNISPGVKITITRSSGLKEEYVCIDYDKLQRI